MQYGEDIIVTLTVRICPLRRFLIGLAVFIFVFKSGSVLGKIDTQVSDATALVFSGLRADDPAYQALDHHRGLAKSVFDAANSSAGSPNKMHDLFVWVRAACIFYPLAASKMMPSLAFDDSNGVAPPYKIDFLGRDDVRLTIRTVVERKDDFLAWLSYAQLADEVSKVSRDTPQTFIFDVLDGLSKIQPGQLQKSPIAQATLKFTLEQVASRYASGNSAPTQDEAASLIRALTQYALLNRDVGIPVSLRTVNSDLWATVMKPDVLSVADGLPGEKQIAIGLLGKIALVRLNPAGSSPHPSSDASDLYHLVAHLCNTRSVLGKEDIIAFQEALFSGDRAKQRLFISLHVEALLTKSEPDQVPSWAIANVLSTEIEQIQTEYAPSIKLGGADWIIATDHQNPVFHSSPGATYIEGGTVNEADAILLRPKDRSLLYGLLNGLTIQDRLTLPARNTLLNLVLTDLVCRTSAGSHPLKEPLFENFSSSVGELENYWNKPDQAGEESRLFFGFMRWTPQFWHPSFWISDTKSWNENGVTQTRKRILPQSFSGGDVERHGEITLAIKLLLKRLAGPIATSLRPAPFIPAGNAPVKDSEDAHAYAYLFSSAQQDFGPEIGAALQSLFAYFYGDQIIVLRTPQNDASGRQPTPSPSDGKQDQTLAATFKTKLESPGNAVDALQLRAIPNLLAKLRSKDVSKEKPYLQIYRSLIADLFYFAQIRLGEEEAKKKHMAAGFVHDTYVWQKSGDMPLTNLPRERDKGLLAKNEIKAALAAASAALELLEPGPNPANSGLLSIPVTPIAQAEEPLEHSAEAQFGLLGFLRMAYFHGTKIPPSDNENDLPDSIPLKRIGRPTPLGMIPPERDWMRNVDNDGRRRPCLPPLASLYDQALARADIALRARREALSMGLDAFGFQGPVQRGSVEQLEKTLKAYGDLLGTAQVTEVRNMAERALTLDREEELVQAADAEVLRELGTLSALERDLQVARFGVTHEELGQEAAKIDALAYHFVQESARQRADAARSYAAEALVEYNEKAFQTFQTRAQYEMILTALPAYIVELAKAQNQLGKTDQKIKDFDAQLVAKRREYLDSKGKDLGSLISSIAFKLVDVACMAYGLPPLGSLVQSSFTAIKAAADEDWDTAFHSAMNAAKLVGVDEQYLKNQAQDWCKSLGVGDLVESIQQNKALQKLGKSAKDAGIDQYVGVQLACLANNAAKSVLPAKMREAFLTAGDQPAFSKGLHFDNDSKAAKTLLIGTVASGGQRLIDNFLRSPANAALQALGDSKRLKTWIINTKGQRGLDASVQDDELEKALEEMRGHAVEGANEIVTARLELLKPEKYEGFREHAAARLLLNQLRLQPVSRERQAKLQALASGLDDAVGKLEASEKLKALEAWFNGAAKTYITDLGPGADQTLQTWFAVTQPWSKLKQEGLPPITGETIKVLGESLLSTLAAETLRKSTAMKPADLQAYIDETGGAIRAALLESQTAVDLCVSVETSRKFVPKEKGTLITVLADWEQETTDRLKSISDADTRKKIQDYMDSVKKSYGQTSLHQLLDDNDWKKLANPPQVTLDPAFKKVFENFDGALQEAGQLARQINDPRTAGQIHKQIDKISQYESDSDFNNARQQLFKIFRDQLAAIKLKIDEARDAAGSPIGTELGSNFDKQIAKSADLDYTRMVKCAQRDDLIGRHETFQNCSLKLQQAEGRLAAAPLVVDVKRERDVLQRDVEFWPRLTADLDQGNWTSDKIQAAVKDARIELLRTMKLSYDDASKHSGAKRPHAETPEEQKVADLTDYQLLFEIGGHNSKAPIDPSLNRFLFECVASIVDKMVADLQGTMPPGKLFSEALRLRDTEWHKFNQETQGKLNETGKQAEALSWGLAAAAENTRKNAMDVRARQAAVRVEMAKFTIKALEGRIGAQHAQVKSVEARHRAAGISRELALLDVWSASRLGEDVNVYSPSFLQLLNREIWHGLYDLDFMSRYFMGDPAPGNVIREQISNGVDRCGNWRPSVINKLVNGASGILPILRKIRNLKPTGPTSYLTTTDVVIDPEQCETYGKTVIVNGRRYVRLKVRLAGKMSEQEKRPSILPIDPLPPTLTTDFDDLPVQDVSSLIQETELKTVGALASTLRFHQTALSLYLWNRLSSGTRQWLNDSSPKSEGDLRRTLSIELNEILKGESIFNEQRFAGINIGPETLALQGMQPKEEGLIRLNRTLLAEAYPAHISRFSVGGSSSGQSLVLDQGVNLNAKFGHHILGIVFAVKRAETDQAWKPEIYAANLGDNFLQVRQGEFVSVHWRPTAVSVFSTQPSEPGRFRQLVSTNNLPPGLADVLRQGGLDLNSVLSDSTPGSAAFRNFPLLGTWELLLDPSVLDHNDWSVTIHFIHRLLSP
jgi:hypothetical protein